MSASESSPKASNLHASIEQLIAETVQRSQSLHEAEAQQLKATLQSVTVEVESAYAAMSRALEILKMSMVSEPAVPAENTIVVGPMEEAGAPIEAAEADAPEPEEMAASEETSDPAIGPHRMDLIAHDVTFGIATSLQSMLRGRPEVKTAHTREFVNGELRLDLDLESGLDISVLTSWISEHGGRIANKTESVLELRFDS